MKLTPNLTGALLMMAAMSGFTINDGFMKALGADVPLMQAIFLRGLGVVPCLALLAYATGQLRFDLPRVDWHRILWRGLAELIAAILFIWALFNMPIANVSAILQALPLTVSLAAALFLGEALGWRRITAILIGFVGVMLIVKPGGAGFTVHSLAALGAVAIVTFRDLIVRRLSPQVPSLMVALVAATIVMLGAGVGSIFVDWQPMDRTDALQLGGAVGFLIVGYICSVQAMRVGEIAVVAPFRYTSLLVAIVIGIILFRERPDALTLLGAGIVVATGLFTLYRETRRGRPRAAVGARLR